MRWCCVCKLRRDKLCMLLSMLVAINTHHTLSTENRHPSPVQGKSKAGKNTADVTKVTTT